MAALSPARARLENEYLTVEMKRDLIMSENGREEKSECSREHVNCFCMGAGPEMFAMFKKLGPRLGPAAFP